MTLVDGRRLFAAVLLALCTGATACKRSTPERWIIPAGYVGWLRLDYSVKGAPSLPLERGRYVVRVPPSGRVATSTVNYPSVDSNDYNVQDPGGLRKLYFGWPPAQGYAVQIAYGQGKVGAPANGLQRASVNIEFEYLFVGTRSEFSTNGRNCSAWNSSDQEPPKFPPRPVPLPPAASPEPRPK